MNETISIIQEEESKRSVLLKPQNMEGLAMVANKGSDQKASTVDNKTTDRLRASNRDNKKTVRYHMTHSSHQFNNHNSYPNNRKIATADGSLTIVASVGGVQISPTLTIRNVFHVPKLSTNLVSMQKLTQDLGCNVTVYPTHYVFQDKDLGKIIGLAKERNRLYYLVSFVYVHSPNKRKLDPQAIKCIFVGYSSTQKGCKCYHPPSKRFLS